MVDTTFDNVPQKMLFIVDKLLDKPLLSRKVVVEEDPTFDHCFMGIGACLSASTDVFVLGQRSRPPEIAYASPLRCVVNTDTKPSASYSSVAIAISS